MQDEKENIIFEDETMKISAVPNLMRIVVECKSQKDFELYKSIFEMLPALRKMFIQQGRLDPNYLAGQNL